MTHEGCPNCGGNGCWLCGGTMLHRIMQMQAEAEDENFAGFCKAHNIPTGALKQSDRIVLMDAIRWGMKRREELDSGSVEDPEDRMLRRFELIEVGP